MNVILMRGIPGSGKSTYVEKLRKELGNDLVVCSADNYFMVDGEYRFDFTKLGDAHAACLNRFTRWVVNGRDLEWAQRMTLLVDNTNLSALELAPYILLARAFFMPCKIVNVLCDPKVAAERNVHGVPSHAIERMAAIMEGEQLPPYWSFDVETIDNR